MATKRYTGGAIALALCLAAPAWADSGNGVGTQFELAFWQSVSGSDDPALYEAYLQQYPAGTFSALAKAKLAGLSRGGEPARAVPVASAPVVVTRGSAAALPETGVATGSGAAIAAVAALTPPAASAEDTASGAKLVLLAYETAQMTDDAAPASGDTALLEELAKSKEMGAGSLKVAVAQGFALPARPVMNDVPDLPLPLAFCSVEQRNAFHDTRYKPLLEIAQANNTLAVVHMQHLQQVYDSYQLARDPAPMNAVAREASAWREVAVQVYNRQMAMVQQFQAIMAVPVTACQMAAAQ